MDITEIRRLRLEEAVRLAGSVAKLAEDAGLSEKYLRQILAGFQGKKDRRPRRLGDEAARRIENAFEKPHGWMDTAPVVPPHETASPKAHEARDRWPFASIRYKRFEDLSDEQKEDVEDLVEHQIAKFESKKRPPRKSPGAAGTRNKGARHKAGKSERAA